MNPASRRLIVHSLCFLTVAAVSALRPGASLAQAPASDAPQAWDLRPRFVQGQVSRFQIWSLRQENSTIEAGGQRRSYSTKFQVDGEVTWTVDRVNSDGSATCTMTIDWMRATATQPDGSVQSEDTRQGPGENARLHQYLRAIAGAPIRVDVANSGAINGVAGVEQVQQRAGDEVTAPDELDFIESANDLATLPGALGDLAAGHGWTSDFVWTHEMGKVHASMTYNLDSVEEIAGIKVANVSGKAPKLRFELDREKIPPDGPRIDVRMLNGEASTQVMFDLSRHEAVGRNTIQSQKLEVRASFAGQTLVRTVEQYVQSQTLRISER